MTNVEEIEHAIRALPRDDFFRLHEWVHRKFETEWDKEIEEDIETGALDEIAKQAIEEHRSNKSSPFPSG